MNNDVIKLIDFGISKALKRFGTQQGTIIGTPGFIDPEMNLEFENL